MFVMNLQVGDVENLGVFESCDVENLGVFESFKVKQAILLSATEAAEMILRVDDIIRCAPRKQGDGM